MQAEGSSLKGRSQEGAQIAGGGYKNSKKLGSKFANKNLKESFTFEEKGESHSEGGGAVRGGDSIPPGRSS